MRRKPQLRRLDLRIAIANQCRPYQIANQTAYPGNPQRPRQRKLPNHRIRRERKRNPPKPTPRARNPTRQTPPPQKPLRHNLHTRREDRAHARADGGALREVQLPGLRGEGGGDETRGHEEAAAGHDEFAAEFAGQDCPKGAEEQGAAEDEAADESVVHGCGGGEVRAGEVVGEVDAVGLGVVSIHIHMRTVWCATADMGVA